MSNGPNKPTAATVIVTGTSSGLGFEIAKTVLQHPEPTTNIFTVRDPSAPNAQPLSSLVQASKNPSDSSIASLELSSLSAVRTFAASIKSRISSGELPPIRALILNAGLNLPEHPRFTDDGFELMFQVNYLANFLLVNLLLDSMDKQKGRIVFVSSWSHDTKFWVNESCKPPNEYWREDLEEIARPTEQDKPGDAKNAGFRRYGSSKLWLLMFMYHLQSLLTTNPQTTNISALSVDPGGMLSTNIMRSYPLFDRLTITWPLHIYSQLAGRIWPNGLMRLSSKSAADVTRAALVWDDPVLGEYPKAAFMNGSVRKEKTSEESLIQERWPVLWKKSVEWAGLKKEEMVV
ncbi:NAD(P)-binding protein [Saccharata proteae CBS 121410]|uniref:NAD(P)-binding protein n=1 Tax=Saccharata proteae CBS 121410 TaxID=1314787 RepID=A0A9P4HT23_9PEZI|nr:NAD(P)-binding protein [Saccharata proteae CBS 121410]